MMPPICRYLMSFLCVVFLILTVFVLANHPEPPVPVGTPSFDEIILKIEAEIWIEVEDG